MAAVDLRRGSRLLDVPASDLAALFRGSLAVKQFPSVAELQGAWTAASHALRDRLDAITAAELDAPITSPFPLR